MMSCYSITSMAHRNTVSLSIILFVCNRVYFGISVFRFLYFFFLIFSFLPKANFILIFRFTLWILHKSNNCAVQNGFVDEHIVPSKQKHKKNRIARQMFYYLELYNIDIENSLEIKKELDS